METGEIPEDIQQTARAWTSGWQEVGGYSDLHMQAIRETIARALLAERERCAKIAGEYDSLAAEAIRYGRPQF